MNHWDHKSAKIEDLIGKTFTKVENRNDEELVFVCDEGEYIFYHSQDCCESVYIEDVCGDLSDLVGSPILTAEESSSSDPLDGHPVPEYEDSFTWTFYKFATVKGWVDVRWYGSSNGYYSESVDMCFKENA